MSGALEVQANAVCAAASACAAVPLQAAIPAVTASAAMQRLKFVVLIIFDQYQYVRPPW
jgi:hypothetical protein